MEAINPPESEDAMNAEPTPLTEEDRQTIELALGTDTYKAKPVPQEIYSELSPDFLRFVTVPYKLREVIAQLYDEPDYLERLVGDWAYAYKVHALRMFNEKTVTFPTRNLRANGLPLEVSISRSTRADTRPWYISFIPSLESVRKSRDKDPFRSLPEAIEPLPPLPAEGFEAARDSEDYLDSPVPEDVIEELTAASRDFTDLVWTPEKQLQKLAACAKASIDLKALLNRDWDHALSTRTLRYFDGKVSFPLSCIRDDGETLVEATIKRDRDAQIPGSKPWVLLFIDSRARQKEKPGELFGKWAHIGDWNKMLASLAEMALPEQWSFDYEEDAYPILGSYLTYTFYRLDYEGKVLENAEKGIAAFNTGLVDKTYEAIYACFSPTTFGSAPWHFEEFCKAGSRQWGKKLVSTFNPLPQRATYFSRKEDLLFDGQRPLQRDADHILLDNIGRLPYEFLEEELRGNNAALEALDRVERAEGTGARSVALQDLRDEIEADARTKRRLVNRLDDAIELAQKRVEWNFKTAVPAFYPTKNSMSLLLPLDLTDDERPDVALVVELVESGAYLGQTILTMNMAYNNARLISRPDSDWLNTSIREGQIADLD